MKSFSFVCLCGLIYFACFGSAVFANGETVPSPNADESFLPNAAGAIFTAEMRQTIKREVMSKPGVMLEMANMTDNGYTWTNDVVWAGSSVDGEAADSGSIGNQWYIAGFMFERPRYKGVWLQYAFTLSQSTGEIANFRRWYGNATFR